MTKTRAVKHLSSFMREHERHLDAIRVLWDRERKPLPEVTPERFWRAYGYHEGHIEALRTAIHWVEWIEPAPKKTPKK